MSSLNVGDVYEITLEGFGNAVWKIRILDEKIPTFVEIIHGDTPKKRKFIKDDVLYDLDCYFHHVSIPITSGILIKSKTRVSPHLIEYVVRFCVEDPLTNFDGMTTYFNSGTCAISNTALGSSIAIGTSAMCSSTIKYYMPYTEFTITSSKEPNTLDECLQISTMDPLKIASIKTAMYNYKCWTWQCKSKPKKSYTHFQVTENSIDATHYETTFTIPKNCTVVDFFEHAKDIKQPSSFNGWIEEGNQKPFDMIKLVELNKKNDEIDDEIAKLREQINHIRDKIKEKQMKIDAEWEKDAECLLFKEVHTECFQNITKRQQVRRAIKEAVLISLKNQMKQVLFSQKDVISDAIEKCTKYY